MFDQINKYKASFGRLFEAKTLKVMLEIALLTILLSFLGPIKNMIYTEVVNKLSLGITVKLGIIMFASYIVVQVIEECVSYFQIYLNTVLQLKLGQSVSHEINNKLAKVKLNSLEMYEIHDLVSRANQTIKSSIVSSLNLIIALYTPLATIVLQLASLVWVAWYVPILIAVFNVPYIFILVKSNHRRYELERKITKEKRVEKYFVELLSDRYAAKDIRTYDLVNFFFSKMIDVKEKITLEYKRLCQKNTFQRTIATVTQSMAMAMALLLTGYLVIKKKTPIGAFVLVYNTGRNLQSAVSSFVGTISTWDQFGINFADWNRLMNLEEEPEGDEDCIDKIHEIEMKNVEFRYPQRSESAVKNINLRILTGEKIAIVGENGSGKTTLLYLLLGIYRPISGEASVNGKTMELNLDNYRKKTACLMQKQPLRVWLYARTADARPGVLEEQLNSLYREAERRGYTVVNGGAEHRCAGDLDRPALFAMLAAVRGGRVDAVMLTRLSRFSYHRLALYLILCFLQDHGVGLITTEYELRYILYLRGFERTLLDRAQENGCNALWAEGE